jgi:hypothetical protein
MLYMGLDEYPVPVPGTVRVPAPPGVFLPVPYPIDVLRGVTHGEHNG